MVFRRLFIALGLAAIASACGGIIDPANNKVEPFSGTLTVGGSTTFNNYSISKSGEVIVTMTSVSPTPPSSIGLALGQVISGTCSLLGGGYTVPATVNRAYNFGQLNKGTYCLAVFDPGVLTVPVNFTGTFSHP